LTVDEVDACALIDFYTGASTFPTLLFRLFKDTPQAIAVATTVMAELRAKVVSMGSATPSPMKHARWCL
jgi:hypothetical protein